jgi:hypothetical protein
MADRGSIFGIATLGDEAAWADTLSLPEATGVGARKPDRAGFGVSRSPFLKNGLSEAEQCDLGDYLESLKPRSPL